MEAASQEADSLRDLSFVDDIVFGVDSVDLSRVDDLAVNAARCCEM